MIKNGVDVIHLATGMIVGYPPCPRIDYFKKFIEEKYKIPVVIGTPYTQRNILKCILSWEVGIHLSGVK